MAEYPLLSIIIPTYNSEATIADTLDSICRQTFKNIEVLVLDGLSSDATCDIIRDYSDNNPNIRLISEKDSGVYDAMNKGVTISKGEYLYFLGSDDVFFEEDTLEKLFNEVSPDVDVFYGDVLFKNSKRVYSGESNLEKLIYDQISICHQAIFYSKRTFDLVGIYDLKYFIHADYDFNIRCFRNKELKIQYIDQVIAIFNESGLSGVNSNADGFHTDLTHQNIREKCDVVTLFYENETLKKEIMRLENSRNIRLGKQILAPFRFIKRTLFK
ncbi:MAG: glycosyltransferase [Flavobacteriaceae bacterium]|nr:glycosyltransferase [Flavobacteriaceae bacterium]